MDGELTKNKGLQEFFFDKVKQALELQKISVSEEVEFYLVNVLTHYSRSENLFNKTPEGKIEYKPLALKLHDAVFDAPQKKFFHLKSLGDTALYHAGVFYEGVFKDVVDINYYIMMGGSAYQSLANMTTTVKKNVSDMFCELSEQFRTLVEIMYLTCEKEVAVSDHDLLLLFERYQKTGSLKAQQILKQKGIDPDLIISDLNMN